MDRGCPGCRGTRWENRGRCRGGSPSPRRALRWSRSRAWKRPAAPRCRCGTTGCALPAPAPCRSPPAATAGRATDDGSCRTPQPSRCTVSGEKAGTHTATYSAPSGSGELYCTHSPRRAMTACPARTSIVPPACFTRSRPFSTTVYSSNSGVCPGSTQPAGLRMCATLTASVFELMRPTYSSICFGTLPAATMREGWVMCSGMEPRDGRRGREHGRLVQGELAEARAHTGVRRDRGRELDVGLMVARLGGEEPAVEPRERGVVERLGKEPHAFAAPRLDERGAEERVDQAFGLARTDGLHELPGVRARHLMAERDATRRELSQHLLEVAELLARELRERHQQLPPLGVLEEEAHRGGRRLLLAVNVVEEDLVEVRARTLDPRATRRGSETQHGALLARRRRTAKASLLSRRGTTCTRWCRTWRVSGSSPSAPRPGTRLRHRFGAGKEADVAASLRGS